MILPLIILSLLDGIFCGFRACAGRYGILNKTDIFLKNGWVGFAIAVLINACSICYYYCSLKFSGQPDKLILDYSTTSQAMAYILLIYSFITVLVMLIWTYPKSEVRELASVLILGPFTLIRPYVILLSLLVSIFYVEHIIVCTGFILATLLQLSLEPILDKIHNRIQSNYLNKMLSDDLIKNY